MALMPSGRAAVLRTNLYAGEELRVVPSCGAAIAGRILEEGTGAPLAGAHVFASLGVFRQEGDRVAEAISAADGIRRLADLPAGLCDVAVSEGRHAWTQRFKLDLAARRARMRRGASSSRGCAPICATRCSCARPGTPRRCSTSARKRAARARSISATSCPSARGRRDGFSRLHPRGGFRGAARGPEQWTRVESVLAGTEDLVITLAHRAQPDST